MITYLPLKQITASYEPKITETLQKIVERGWFLLGEECSLFEKEYAEYIGSRICVACGNGYDALWLIFKAYRELGILKDGDEVLVPANTFIASVLAITNNNLIPVFVEPDAVTYLVGEKELRQAITPRCKAFLMVHLYGQCAYNAAIGKFCQEHNLILIEDNAQAHGCLFEKQHTGSLGDAAAHSFYPGKNLGALGDAGAVTTDNEELSNIIASLHNYGSSKKYIHNNIGVNSRMDEFQAGVLRIKLRRLDKDNEKRRKIAHRYIQEITNPAIQTPYVSNFASHVFHIFPLMSESRDKLQHFMTEQGIQTQIHYPIPPHKQQCYALYNDKSFPIAEQLSREELSLPLHPLLTDSEVEKIISTANTFLP